jgi:drug/metabolite transporter (DMT)-like permease
VDEAKALRQNDKERMPAIEVDALPLTPVSFPPPPLSPPSTTSALAVREEKVWLAALYMALSSIFLVTLAVVVKLASREATAMQAVLYRSLFSALPLLITMQRVRISVASRRWPLLLLRGVLGFLALFSYFYAITHTSLANALALQQLAPIFVALLSVWLLHERPQFWHYLLAGLCLLGALLIIQPTRGLISFPALIALLSAVFSSGAYITVRALTRTEPTLRIVLWFSLVATVLALPFVLPQWRWLSWHANLLLMAGGLLAIPAQSLLTAAYRCARAHVAAAFSYANVPLAYLYGLVLWGEHPDRLANLGIAMIVVGGVLFLLLLRASPRHPST